MPGSTVITTPSSSVRRKRSERVPGSSMRGISGGRPPTSCVSIPSECPSPCGMKTAAMCAASISSTDPPPRMPSSMSPSTMTRNARRCMSTHAMPGRMVASTRRMAASTTLYTPRWSGVNLPLAGYEQVMSAP
eukprot:Amastigsp_a681109_78.p4 type:complete len:133 gc:universal Amastigsp_a681109_78:234-632(+)